MTQRAIDGPYIYFVTTNTTYREKFFVTEVQAELLSRIIQNACRLKHFDLLAYCILPDHMHLLIHNRNMVTPQRAFRNACCGRGVKMEYTLSHLMHSIKRNFSREQTTSGRLWQPRYNFRIIDNDQRLYNTLEYIKYNYRKMDLPQRYGKAPWMYLNKKES